MGPDMNTSSWARNMRFIGAQSPTGVWVCSELVSPIAWQRPGRVGGYVSLPGFQPAKIRRVYWLTFNVAVLLVIDPAFAVMLTEPTTNPVANPVFAPMTATVVLEVFQFTEVVMFILLPSAKNPVAVNCWEFEVPLPLTETVALPGETRIDCSWEVVTRTVVVPVMLPDVAVTVVAPAPTPVTSPPLVTAAMALLPVVQVTEGVVVDPSALVPVALNWTVPLISTAGLKGLTVIEVTDEELDEQLVSATANEMSARKQTGIGQRVRLSGDIKFCIVILSPV